MNYALPETLVETKHVERLYVFSPDIYILLLAECSLDGEWEGQIRYLPL